MVNKWFTVPKELGLLLWNFAENLRTSSSNILPRVRLVVSSDVSDPIQICIWHILLVFSSSWSWENRCILSACVFIYSYSFVESWNMHVTQRILIVFWLDVSNFFCCLANPILGLFRWINYIWSVCLFLFGFSYSIGFWDKLEVGAEYKGVFWK